METQKIITRIGKLLSGTRKPDEGFATIYEYEPKDFLEKQHGNLYFVIEVASGSRGASEVGESIINSIKDEFYQDLNRSVILSFESALRKANDELSDITSAGETDWIGKLNVACAVLSEGKLHLSKVGTIEVYILRGNKITHISEGLSLEEEEKENKHPLKTFSAITSGSLERGDKLILSSSELFYHISLAGLKKLVLENKPSGVIKKLKELLKDEEGVSSIGILVIEMITEEDLARERGHEPDEVWIEEPKTTKVAGDFITTFFGGILAFFKNTFKTIKEKIKPSSQKVRKPATSEFGEEIPYESQASEFKKEEAMKTPKEKPKRQESFLSFVVNYFKKFSFEKFFKDVQGVFAKIKDGIKDKTQSIYIKLFIIVAILFVISLIIIVGNYNRDKNIKEIKQKLDQAISLESKAEGALVYEARAEAKEYLNDSKSLALEVLKTKYYNKEAQDLIAKISDLSKKVDGITEVSPDLVLDIDKDKEISNFTLIEKNLYFVNTKSNKLISYDIESKEQDQFEISKSKVTFSLITPLIKKNIILLYNNSPEIAEFNVKSDKATTASAKGGFKKAQALATYESNFYILSREDNQVYRFSKMVTEYSRASNYITDKSVDIKDGVSLTIPGIVYVLKEDGQVVKLIKGKKQEFSFKEMPHDFRKPIKIQSNEGSDKLYVLDKELGVLEFSVNGKYIKNITSTEFKDLKDFYVDETSGIIYVLTGNKIFSFAR